MMNRSLYVLLIIGISCCKKDIPPEPEIVSLDSEAVLVLNEGNFNWGNASIDIYHPNINEYSKGVFEATNNRPLGDVLQSAKIINGQLWLVLNNSGKIEVVDTATFKSIKTITGLNSPRHLYYASGKVYVTDLYAEKVSIINANDYTIEDEIKIEGWTEQIEGSGSQIYIFNKDSNNLVNYSITSKNSNVLQVSGVPFDLKRTASNIWCFSYSADTLFIYNTSLNTSDTFPGLLNQVPSRVVYCAANMSWYLLAGNKLSKLENGKLKKVFELSSGSLYGVECINEEFYISNAKDFVTNSELIRINLKGEVLDNQPTGKITNGFIKLN